MTTDPHHPVKGPRPALRPADRRRHATLAAAAADPELIMSEVEDAFSDLHDLTRRGERVAAARAAAVVTKTLLQLCADPAASGIETENKRRFLQIIARWALVETRS